MRNVVGMAVVCLVAAGCKKDTSCDPADPAACDEGLACEQVEGAEEDEAYQCFPPVVVQGRVFDLADDGGIADARIVVMDVNGSPVSPVGISGDDGAYEVRLPTRRDADGNPLGGTVTLRADAMGYQTFPGGLRPAIPVDASAPVEEDDGTWVVASAVTDIGLIALETGGGAVVGTVERPDEGWVGALVVAEGSGGAASGVTDIDGSYAIFNVPPGAVAVSAYGRGASWGAGSGDVADGGTTEIDLSLDDRGLGAVSGTVQIVNAPGGSMTSVIMVAEATFDEIMLRGDMPPGLRAPEPGTSPNVTGDYTIADVPEGDYVLLAAFENDGLVRDPDTSIGGTQIQHVRVAAGQTYAAEGFKVTEALPIVGPGAEEPEAVDGAPTFAWTDDSSEDFYALVVYDALGNVVWEHTEDRHTGDDPAVVYGGPALEAGMYYQFRVTSIKDDVPISTTEDLRGVFYVP